MQSITQMLLNAANAAGDSANNCAREMAAHCLLDWTGVALAGSGDPLVAALAADAIDNSGRGGWPLLGRHEQVALRDFVLVNGVSGHLLDYDDGMWATLGHPSATIMPALLAIAASRDLSGAKLLDGIVTAVEMAARTGLLLTPAHYDLGFHGTGTVGAIAAAAGAARLMELSEEQSLMAIGLAGTRAAGLRASSGSGGKPLHAGWASLNGFTAACWAERGFTGPLDILGHPAGMARLAGAEDRVSALRGAPNGLHIMNIRFKRFASCAVTHPGIDAATSLRTAHSLTPDAVRKVIIKVNPRSDTICNIAAPSSGLEAKFSFKATIAMALAGIDLSVPGNFDDVLIGSGEHIALRDRVEVEFEPELSMTTCKLRIETTDDQVLEIVPPPPKEGAWDGLSEALQHKFVVLGSSHLAHTDVERLVGRLLGLAQERNVRSLFDELTGLVPA